MQHNRGEIHYRNRAKQIRDFSGLLYGKITPTDIDGLIEYHDRGYVLIEVKLRDADVEYGQRLALERMTDDFTKANKQTICIIARHEIDNPNEDINMANTLVTEYRWGGKWHKPKESQTTKQIVDRFISMLSKNKMEK